MRLLRQVDHRRQLLILVRRHAEAQYLDVAKIAPALRSRAARPFRENRRARPSRSMISRLRRENADRPAGRHRRISSASREHDRHPMHREARERRAQAHRATADHHHRMTLLLDSVAQRKAPRPNAEAAG